MNYCCGRMLNFIETRDHVWFEFSYNSNVYNVLMQYKLNFHNFEVIPVTLFTAVVQQRQKYVPDSSVTAEVGVSV